MTERRAVRWGVLAAVVACAAGAVVGTVVGTVVVAAALVGGTLAVLAFARISMAHGRLARGLRTRSFAFEVAGTRLRLGPVGGSVFVAGLARPEIFCDGDLLRELGDGELRAVALHERAHQLARDPLRASVEAVLAPLLHRFAGGRAWLEHRQAVREIAADRYALAHGADRRAIASALLKVPAAGLAHAAAFTPAAELRLRALLGDAVDLPRQRIGRAIAIGTAAGFVLCVVMLHSAVPMADVLQACCPV